MSGEAAPRSSTDLPGKQLALIKEIDRTGRLYAVALMNGRPLTIEWLHDLAPTVLEALFPGTEAGHAVADVLFGDVNPGGKLPVNFPRNVGQIPLALDAGDTTTSPSSSTVTTSAFWNLARSNLATRRVGVGQLRGRAEGHVHRNRGNADRHAVRPSCPSSVWPALFRRHATPERIRPRRAIAARRGRCHRAAARRGPRSRGRITSPVAARTRAYDSPACARLRRLTASTVTASSRTPPVTMNLIDDE